MTVMTGAAEERAPRRNLGAIDEDHLFATGLVDVRAPSPDPPGADRGPAFARRPRRDHPPRDLPPDLLAGGDARAGRPAGRLLRPASAPAPPLPKGSPLKPEQAKPETPKPVSTETKPKPEFTAPIQTPQPQEARLEPESGVRPEDQFGSATGSDFGDPLGMEEGVEGGIVGGVPGGVLGGVLGGTGTGPVMDYDSPPRPLKQTRPQYPQEAFVKKIEGTVLVEILIDSQGRVVRARVIQSVPLLDAAALQTVYQWVFQPAVKHGRPVATIAHIPVTFRIY